MKIRILLAFSVLLFVFYSCAPTRIVKPLEVGEKQVGVTFGGPLINFSGAVIPIPFTSVWGAYGLDSLTSTWVGVHTTSMAFADLQTDFGFTRKIYSSTNKFLPSVSISPIVNFMHSFRDAQSRFYPELDLNIYWETPKKMYYLTFSNWFVINSFRAHNESQPQHWIPTVNGGLFLNKKGKFNYQLELRYLAPFNENKSVVEYFSLTNTGALGIYFGMTYKLK